MEPGGALLRESPCGPAGAALEAWTAFPVHAGPSGVRLSRHHRQTCSLPTSPTTIAAHRGGGFRAPTPSGRCDSVTEANMESRAPRQGKGSPASLRQQRPAVLPGPPGPAAAGTWTDAEHEGGESVSKTVLGARLHVGGFPSLPPPLVPPGPKTAQETPPPPFPDVEGTHGCFRLTHTSETAGRGLTRWEGRCLLEAEWTRIGAVAAGGGFAL